MKRVRQIHYRYLTDAEFFNLYKPRGTEERGGGQTYIDFRARAVPISAWQRFFRGVTGVTAQRITNGYRWVTPIFSIGLPRPSQPQQVAIDQRRSASVKISAQRLGSRNSNRVQAWLPAVGFPAPVDPLARQGQLPTGLCIYLARTHDGEIYAGWFDHRFKTVATDAGAGRLLRQMLDRNNAPGVTGVIPIPPRAALFLDESSNTAPFSVHSLPGTPQGPVELPENEQQLIDALFTEDVSKSASPEVIRRIQTVRSRNSRAVRRLKRLYRGHCQLSGTNHTFRKRNGDYYAEVHHLIPLGEGGADDPRNMIVVSPLIHRMLHFATIEGLNLGAIHVDANNESSLNITINGQPFTIRWHKAHARQIVGR